MIQLTQNFMGMTLQNQISLLC